MQPLSSSMSVNRQSPKEKLARMVTNRIHSGRRPDNMPEFQMASHTPGSTGVSPISTPTGTPSASLPTTVPFGPENVNQTTPSTIAPVTNNPVTTGVPISIPGANNIAPRPQFAPITSLAQRQPTPTGIVGRYM